MAPAERRKILLIDPDAAAARSVAAWLEPRYAVTSVQSARAARAWFRAANPDVILLELALPDADGLLFCAELRARGRVPLLIHTSQTARRDMLLSFRLGADDFIAKPSDPAEIEARIGALLRRIARDSGPAAPRSHLPVPVSARSGAAGDTQRIGDLRIDRERSIVTVNGRPLHLTQTEFRLLSLFARRVGHILSRPELAQAAGGYEYVAGTRALDMQVRRLRAKLRANPGTPIIAAARGVGYRMLEPDDHTALDHRAIPPA